jgi:hypothetical protein
MPIDGRNATQENMTQGDLVVVPALFEHAVKVYAAMAEEATKDPEINNLLVYDGHLTVLFKKLLLSVPYYTAIKNQLVAMGCIEQVRRGGGGGTSRWVLWKAPELTLWKNTSPVRARQGNKQTMQTQQIKDLAQRLSNLEGIVERLIEALKENK